MESNRQVVTKTKPLSISELAIPFFIYFSLYTLTLSNVPSLATDSISYMNHIDLGMRFFHPHHLLYNSFTCLWIALWRQLGVRTDSAILASELNAIFGTLGLCAFYSVLRVRLGYGRVTALLGTSLPAFSFGFWYYSGCVEVYIIPLLFLWIAFYLLTADHVDARTFALVGVLNGMAVLFAEISVLFAPVVFLAAWYNSRRGENNLAKSFVNYAGAAVPTVAIPYAVVLVYTGHGGSLKSAWFWLTLYTHQSRFWSAPSLSAVVKAGVGLGQAFIGSHFVFALPGFRPWVESMLQGFYLTHDAYLVRNLRPGVAYLLLALSVGLFLTVIISLAVRLGYWSRLSSRNRKLVSLLFVWVLAYGIFVFFYTAVNPKLWIAQTLCLWMIFLVCLLGIRRNPEKPDRWPGIVLASAVVLIVLVNFMGSIRFTQERTNDYYYSRIEPLLSASGKGDLVVIGTAWKFEPYLRRYGKASILSLTSVYRASGASPTSVQRVQTAIDHELATGGKVIVSREAVEPEKETVQLYPGISIFGTLWDRYRERWSEREFPSGLVYVLQLAQPSSSQAQTQTTTGSQTNPGLSELGRAEEARVARRIRKE